MNLTTKIVLIIAGSMLLLALGFAGFMAFRDQQRVAQITELKNQIAERDKTIELQKNVYQKLTLQTKDLTKLLDDKDVELVALREQLKKQGADLLTASTLIAKLKKDLESAGHVEPPLPDEGPTVRTVKFNSGNDFDPFLVSGQTTVNCDNPSERDAKLLLQQKTPLKFSVVVSQDEDGTWRTTASSSSDKFDVDIALAAVNPYILEEKWYEKLSFVVETGVGTNPGLLAGVGADVEIGKFDVGPRVWAVLDHGASPYFGASLSWHPFKKTR